MREEEEGSWFALWDEELPSPEELMPLSQTLITPDLALAFDIPTSGVGRGANHPPPPPPPRTPLAAEFDTGSGEMSGGGGADEPARTLKRPRLVWTPQLHKRFVDAVAHLGIKNAVPKTIMQLMSVDGLTRENVASHLQKYRLYLKRMQGLNSPAAGSVSAADAATDQLFASTNHYYPRPAPAAPEHFLPYPALQNRQNMAAAVAAQQQQQQQYYHQRQIGHFAASPAAAAAAVGFDHGFLARQQHPGMYRMAGLTGLGVAPPPPQTPASYTDDLDSGAAGGGGATRVLTLFPTGDD